MPTVTCNACNAGFDDEEQQRLHYRSEWHRYNLKRKVKLEQGLQMLTIFKSHEAETTILEDFDFYEQREKALQENRRQQQPASTDPQKLLDTKAKGPVADISDAFSKAV
ncbi:unnamed protein product [Miscanthus lutarioriparius]|uniref:C2H2-type domain-containing protein n=1 Tax=Miscanthus lutarioriparius TaxID=422564 RepID=A0A811PMD0_9POAL|nr:unnamed protein product [Miscanthus lutarioriparius]